MAELRHCIWGALFPLLSVCGITPYERLTDTVYIISRKWRISTCVVLALLIYFAYVLIAVHVQYLYTVDSSFFGKVFAVIDFSFYSLDVVCALIVVLLSSSKLCHFLNQLFYYQTVFPNSSQPRYSFIGLILFVTELALTCSIYFCVYTNVNFWSFLAVIITTGIKFLTWYNFFILLVHAKYLIQSLSCSVTCLNGFTDDPTNLKSLRITTFYLFGEVQSLGEALSPYFIIEVTANFFEFCDDVYSIIFHGIKSHFTVLFWSGKDMAAFLALLIIMNATKLEVSLDH